MFEHVSERQRTPPFKRVKCLLIESRVFIAKLKAKFFIRTHVPSCGIWHPSLLIDIVWITAFGKIATCFFQLGTINPLRTLTAKEDGRRAKIAFGLVLRKSGKADNTAFEIRQAWNWKHGCLFGLQLLCGVHQSIKRIGFTTRSATLLSSRFSNRCCFTKRAVRFGGFAAFPFAVLGHDGRSKFTSRLAFFAGVPKNGVFADNFCRGLISVCQQTIRAISALVVSKVENTAVDILDAFALQISTVLRSQTCCCFSRLSQIVRVFQAHAPRCAGNELERTPSSALLVVEILSAAALGLIDAAKVSLRQLVPGFQRREELHRVH